MRTWVLAIGLLSASVVCQRSSAQAAPPPPPVPAGCQASTTPATEADAALYQQDFGKAERLYRAVTSPNAAVVQARAGIVRATLGEEKIDEAIHLAETLATEFPRSAIAQEALGEAYTRSGELALAPNPLALALKLDPCLSRAHLGEGRLLLLSGLRASAEHQFAAAHALDPSDLDATYSWLRVLPAAQGTSALSDFLFHTQYLNIARNQDLGYRAETLKIIAGLHTTVSVDALPARLTLIPGPEHGPDPGISSIDVAINGHKRRLEVSTDTHGITILRTVAVALGVKPVFHYTESVPYITGRVPHYLGVIDDLRIGSVDYKNFPVDVIDEDFTPDRGSEGVDGFFGFVNFEDFLVHVNYRQHEIQLSALPPLPANQTAEGLPIWSTVTPGQAVPSVNGGAWGNPNRIVVPSMRTWTPFFRREGSIFLLTQFGTGPDRLFTFDLDALHPRLATSATKDIATLRTAGLADTHSKFNGDFTRFAGVTISADGWTALRYDESSLRLNLEISGILDGSALRALPFDIDYRDQLIHFETTDTK